MLSKYANKHPTLVEDFNQIPIMISYQFQNSKAVTKELFPTGTSFPSTKSITFQQKDGGMSLLVHYHDKFKLMDGLPNQIAQYEIQNSTMKPSGKFDLVLTVSNNLNNIAVLDKAEVIYEFKDKGVNKKKYELLKFRLSSYALPPKEKKAFFDLECQMI